MGKGMDRKKEDKKKPSKTLDEKRAAKREKKQAKSNCSLTKPVVCVRPN